MTPDIQTLSAQLKSARIQKGYTQAQLAELTRVSLRSIQRIENGKVNPRSYTLKILADNLEIELELLSSVNERSRNVLSVSSTQKIILSITLGVVTPLLGGAFLSQTARFPETNFELMLFWTLLTAVLGALLLKIWR